MRIFISHSSHDEPTAQLLITLLHNALQNLNKEDIFCTSVEGHGIPPGNDADDAIRNTLNKADLLIGLITPSAIKSTYVLFELGGRWLTKKPMIPLLACGAELQHLDGPLTRIQVKNCSREAEVRDFIEHAAKTLSLPTASPAFYVPDIQQFVQAATEIQETEILPSSNPPQPSHPPQRHPAYELAPLTKQLLIEASTPIGPNAGQITTAKTIAHTVIRTDTSTREMSNGNDTAIRVLHNAMEELGTNKLIVEAPSLSLRENSYALTQKGFQFGDILRHPIQPMHEKRLAIMRHYYVDTDPVPGQHRDVHYVDCPRFLVNHAYLGYFSSCAQAVEEARGQYPDADGCSVCSPECRTS